MLQSWTSIQGMARSTYLSLHHLRMQLNWYLFAVLPIGSSAIWWLLVIGKLGQFYRGKQRKFEAVRSRIKPKPLDLPPVVMVGSVSKRHFSSLELRCAIKSVSDVCKPLKTQDLCYGREDKLPLWAFFWRGWIPTTSYLMVGSKLSPLGFRMPDPYDFTADQQCNFEELQTCQFPKVFALKINPADRGDIWSSAPQLKSDSSTHGATTQMAAVSIVSVNLLSADSHLVCSIAEWVIAREFCWSAKMVNGSVRNII